MKDTLNCKGITRCQNNEYGQDVKHYHMHLIPRYENDGFDLKVNSKDKLSAEEVFSKIKS